MCIIDHFSDFFRGDQMQQLVGNSKHDVLKALLRVICRKYYPFSFNSDKKVLFRLFPSFTVILNALKIYRWFSQ